ncbi:MAG: hypothetical protein AAF694_15995 [Bacteroidota bacterium]
MKFKPFISLLFVRLISLGFFLLFVAQNTWAQCSSCKAAASTKDGSGELVIGGGLNSGILFLLAMPFLLAGFIAIIWIRRKKQIDLEQTS